MNLNHQKISSKNIVSKQPILFVLISELMVSFGKVFRSFGDIGKEFTRGDEKDLCNLN